MFPAMLQHYFFFFAGPILCGFFCPCAVIQNEDGTITILEPGGRVVYMGQPPRRGYYDGYGYGGMGMGFLGGAMLGSALMWPWILY